MFCVNEGIVTFINYRISFDDNNCTMLHSRWIYGICFKS